MIKPILSIVVPTREGVPEIWIQELLKVRGDVEFIIVHPPGCIHFSVVDPRLKQINSPLRGEIIQRMTALLTARGIYVLSMNCDEYITPYVVQITEQYFQRFSDSWLMRLSKKEIPFGEKEKLTEAWPDLLNIEQCEICGRALGNQNLYGEKNYILEMPIAPLQNKFNICSLIQGRKDHHGPHTENFDKKVWKNQMVQDSLQEIVPLLTLAGPFKYIPFWCLDRFLGLFIQAKFFEEGKIIGHLLPLPEQIRIEDNPPQFARTGRFYVLSEILLLRRFPQYGYFWNLILDELRDIPLIPIKFLQRKVKEMGNRKQKTVTG